MICNLLKRALTTTLALLLFAASAHAERNSVQRVKTFAALPNWTGIWESDFATLFNSPSGHLEGAADGEEISHVKLVVFSLFFPCHPGAHLPCHAAPR